ncbi:hypothetical protein [Pseudomonas baetica]|uniref:hypothetical protein n=1 Tax=Pseudomonas baetica TaxID=674054 RepID=UPI00240641D7|nr:hypothetical protein [Pseudomonas baetica]MDF9777819.1 hypothetical protein [Pseudomonas baetica]
MEGCSQAIAEGITEYATTLDEHTDQFRMNDVVLEMENLVTILDDVIAEESGDAPTFSEAIARTTTSLMDGDPDAVNQAKDHIALEIDDLSLFEGSKHHHEPDIALQRAQTIVDSLGELLGKLGRNEFEGDLGRLASNLTIGGLRTGLIVGTLTTIRQLIGFALEKCLQSNAASPLTRNVIGGVSLMIGPALNILGALRDECNGTANTQTRLSRLLTLSLSLAAFAVALVTPQALPALASFGPQMAFFTLARDLTQVFVPLNDNAQINPPGTAANAGLYGALQFLLGTAMDHTAPNSGAGYAMSAGSGPSTADGGFAAQLMNWMQHASDTLVTSNSTPETRAAEILESLVPVLGHDILRGVYNAGVEIMSDVAGGEMMHRFQSERAPDGFRITFAPRVPSASQVADQFLTTSAMRTSFGGAIMAAAISAGTYFGSLGLSASVVNHAVNAVVAAVAIAGLPGFFYAHQGNRPVDNTTV